RSNLSKLERLHRELHQLDLDGYLIVPGTDKPRISEILSAARHRLLNRRWRRLSGMFESVASVRLLSPTAKREKRSAVVASIPRLHAEPTTRDCEEGAQAG